MIDEKKLIDFIDAGKFRNPDELHFSENDVVRLIKNFAELSNELKLSEQPKADWIPCEERLPEPAKRYLVSAIWIDGNYVSKPTVYDAVFGTDGKWHTYDYKEVPYEVIAWQPIQPYKKEGAE